MEANKLEHIQTEGDRLIARIVSNIVRISVSRDGPKCEIDKLSEIFEVLKAEE